METIEIQREALNGAEPLCDGEGAGKLRAALRAMLTAALEATSA